MRPRKDALAGLLDVLQLDRDVVWRSSEFAPHASSPEKFELHAVAVCGPGEAGSTPGHRGARTARRIAERVSARESECTRRTALDLARLADLHDRMRLREAETARRRWFVLGRLLMRAAAADSRWAAVVDELVAASVLTAAEGKALGLSRRK